VDFFSLNRINEIKTLRNHATQQTTVRFLVELHDMLDAQGELSKFDKIPGNLIEFFENLKDESPAILKMQLNATYNALDEYVAKGGIKLDRKR